MAAASFTQTLIEWATHYRPILEMLAVVFTSALVGFLTARAIYRSKVTTRTEMLRFEEARWRRKLSQSRRSTEVVLRERDRSLRRLKKLDISKGRAPMPG
jgi:hypothetical protein